VKKYRCNLCNCIWIYNLEEKENNQKIEQKISAEDFPNDWYCPLCNKGKSELNKIELRAA